MRHIYIIAEIGCNHCGDPILAKKMVDEARACGVDAVKFQTFKAAELISRYAPKADYQKATTGNEENQLEMTRKLELPYDEFVKLRDYAISLGLDTFSTPFDMDSIAFLEEQKQTIWKIPSGEVTNLPFLERIAKFRIPNKKIILSTGMCTIEEIHQAVDINDNDVSNERVRERFMESYGEQFFHAELIRLFYSPIRKCKKLRFF